MATFVAVCVGGLEDEVVMDIASFLPPNTIIDSLPKSTNRANAVEVNGKWLRTGESGCGKIVVRNVQECSFIHSVRSVQHWLVYMADSLTVPTNAISGIEHIQHLTSKMDFDATLKTWIDCLPDVVSRKAHLVNMLNRERPPKFCVRCIRDGEHKFTSLDVAMKIGETVLSKTNWTVDLCNMDFEIIALLMSETIVIGINVLTQSPAFLKSRIPGN